MALATAVDRATLDRSSAGRWIYFLTASLLLVTAVVGFFPRSVEILTGARRNPPLVVHIHAAIIVAWLGLLFVQTWLVARRQTRWHRALGMASFLLGPAVVGSMIAVTIWRFGERVSLGQTVAGANTLMAQSRATLYFSIFFIWALLTRRTDPETHKRMILLASIGPFTAAFARMTWLPTTLPESPISGHLYMLGLLLPAIAYDVIRLGRPHTAWLVGLALMLPWLIATELLWNTPWWTATATRLMGY
jgi:hypothetical protein